MTDRNPSNRYEGGDLVVESLKNLGVGQVFSVSGGVINSIYRAAAAHDLPLVHTRHEAAAGFMAEAVARQTGVPGVAAVTVGPGVTNTVTSAFVAKRAGTPFLILGGQVPTPVIDRGAVLEGNHVAIMAPVTKWSARVLQTERIPEYIEAAWRHMWSGRPGPVFLEIPADVLSAQVARMPPAQYRMSRPGLNPEAGAALAEALAAARRPLLVIGDDCHWDPPAALAGVIERLDLPFVTARLARGVVDERHPRWAGVGCVPANETLDRALGEADLVLLLGHHFEADLGYGQAVRPDATVAQCAVDAGTLGRNRRADLGMVAAPSALVDFMAGLAPGPVDRSWVAATVGAWDTERTAQAGADPETPPVHPVAAVDAVIDALPEDTIYVSSHGNVDFWADARIKVRGHRRYLRAGQSGALGAEIPYGIGAKFIAPERPVVVFVGDGGVGFHVLELDTAARHGRPVVVVVLDDQKWSAIALPQQRTYGAEYEMDLPARDWPGLARALGGFGVHAETLEEIGQAVRAAHASNQPAIVQVPVRAVLSPYMDYITL
jgi:acetolactate synthase-1/2/3 large subunit